LEDSFKSRKESQSIQVTETTFQPEEGSLMTCRTHGVLQMLAFAMRHHQDLPRTPVKKNPLTTPRAKVDRGVLHRSAVLAGQWGFDSPEIMDLKAHPTPSVIQDAPESVPLLVTTGPGVIKRQRCGIPRTDSFEDDRKYLFLNKLCEERDESGEGITSFFVLKSWFIAFFNPPRWSRLGVSTESSNPLPPPAFHQRAYEDVDMGGARPRDVDHREQEQEQEIIQVRQIIDSAERIQETIDLAQQEMSGHAVEANQRLEMEQETQARAGQFLGNIPFHGVFLLLIKSPLALGEASTQSQAVGRSDTVIIYFVEGKSNESDMMRPIEEYESVQELRVDPGDPSSLIERAVGEFL